MVCHHSERGANRHHEERSANRHHEERSDVVIS